MQSRTWAGSSEFRRRFLSLVAAQLDGRTCGMGSMAAELLAEASDLPKGTMARETLEAMSASGAPKERVAKGTSRGCA
jgi:hypothetical protein